MIRKFPLALSAIALPLFAVVLLVGCGEEKKVETVAPTRPKKEKTDGGKKEIVEGKSYDAVVKGRVVLDGTSPKIEFITQMGDHADKKTCLAADATEEEKMAQQWLVSKDKGVANVVIKIVPVGKNKEFKKVDPAKTEVEIDQPHCAFVPHVVAVGPGQKLKVLNSAPVPHNTKLSINPAFNKEVSSTIEPGKSTTLDLNYQKEPIGLTCDFHKWMNAYVHMVDTPYFAVTKADGTFEITGVPTGVPVVVIGVHEAGDVEGGKEGVTKTFTPGDNQIDLKVKAR